MGGRDSSESNALESLKMVKKSSKLVSKKISEDSLEIIGPDFDIFINEEEKQRKEEEARQKFWESLRAENEAKKAQEYEKLTKEQKQQYDRQRFWISVRKEYKDNRIGFS